MSTTTTNYGFVKPALTDAPPDITVMNTNWDKIDTELKNRLPSTGGTITGNLDLKLVEGNGVAGLYKNHSATNDFGFRVVDISKDNEKVQLALVANTNELLFYDNNNKKNQVFGEHNLALLRQYIATDVPASLV